MPITLDGTSGITTPMYNGSITANAVTPSVNMKNRIINGAMVIDQRNAGASVTPTGGQYSLDRWYSSASQNSKFTVQRNAGSVTQPAGFTNYLGITSSSAYTVGASELFTIAQQIEGFNIADLGWGTANAKTVTLSFWVRSSLTGTFGGVINNDGSSRSYPFTYTISSANTWEYETVTITGDTSGTWGSTNGTGINLRFGLGVGSSVSGTAGSWSGSTFYGATGATSVVGTNGATFYITGVQLEVGSTATSFDYRPYGTELALCQRYYWRNSVTEAYGWLGLGTCLSATNARIGIALGQTMRTAPTLSSGGATRVYDGGTAVSASSFVMNNNSLVYPQLDVTTNSGLTQGRAAFLGANNNANTYLAFDAEL
jgi:hypothetical protein